MTLVQSVQRIVPKLVITNLYSGDELIAQFNPSTLREQLGANWSRLQVPGLSHERLQFVHTENFKLNLAMQFRADQQSELVSIHRARRLLLSWCYPREVANDVVGGGAPRLLLTWPKMLAMGCVLTAVSIEHTLFTVDAQSRRFLATLQLEEIRDVAVFFQDVVEDSDLRFGADQDLIDEFGL